MKKVVISLKRRTDRKQNFNKNSLKNYRYLEAIDYKLEDFSRTIKARENWVGPFNNRPLLKSEIACFLSHAKAWEECIRLDEPIIILEDDAVINNTWDEEYYRSLIDTYDFVYLQRNENEPTKVININDKIEKPFYPYNLTAYVIKPKTARILLEHVNIQDMIPVDEYLPEMITTYNYIDAVALKEDACNQLSREESSSDIESSNVFREFKVHPLTIGTDRKKCSKLNTSASKVGINVKNLGTNVVWLGTDMSGPGGGMKVNLLRDYIKNLPSTDIVLFTDAYDVFYALMHRLQDEEKKSPE